MLGIDLQTVGIAAVCVIAALCLGLATLGQLLSKGKAWISKQIDDAVEIEMEKHAPVATPWSGAEVPRGQVDHDPF
jgi:hypothetical protein